MDDILLSMFPGSLTVVETTSHGMVSTHTHFLADPWMDQADPESLICWGLRSYNQFLPPMRDYHHHADS